MVSAKVWHDPLSLYQVDILNMESTVVCGYLNNEIFHYKHSSHPHRKKTS